MLKMKKTHLFLISIVLLSIGFAFWLNQGKVIAKIPVSGDGDNTEIVSNELFIKLTANGKSKVKSEDPAHVGVKSLEDVFARHHVQKFESVGKVGKKSKTGDELFQWYKVTLDGPSDHVKVHVNKKNQFLEAENGAAVDEINKLADDLKKNEDVIVVEPNYIVTAQVVPNDPYYASTGTWGQSFADMWGMQKINADAAWDQTTGSADIVVASIDTGVDRNHPDLAPNMWVNAAETPGNGIDDDANGYVDDYYGWNFVAGNGDPMDDYGHGTHTAGTIAAAGNNNSGVVGVNWTSRVMAVKFMDQNGSGTTGGGVQALQYAADMGARVSSNSWVCGCNSTLTDDAVAYEHDHGMVVVVAAGNSAADALGFSPASSDAAVTVAASDQDDVKPYFSNYGGKIDVAAPGVDILSTCISAQVVPGGNYCHLSGTSMATPHVAGLAALLLAKNPQLTNEEVRQILRKSSVDIAPPGKDADFGFGRIDVSAAIGAASSNPLTPYITSPKSRTQAGDTVTVVGTANGNTFSRYIVEAGAGRTPSSWTTLADSTTPVTDNVLASVSAGMLTEGANIIRLTVIDTAGQHFEFQVSDIYVDNFDAAILSPVGTASSSVVAVSGQAMTKNGLILQGYQLEWGQNTPPSGVPSSWSTTGITLANGGTQPVPSGGALGTWDTTGLVSGQSYTLRLTVASTTGQSTQVSSLVTISQSRVVTITSPSDKTMVQGPVLVAVGIDGPLGFASVSVKVDGQFVGSDNTAPYEILWDTTSLADNSIHTITAEAQGSGFQNSISAPVSVTVHNNAAAPTVSITSPANNTSVEGSVLVRATAMAISPRNMAKVDFFVDDVLLSTVITPPLPIIPPVQTTWDTTSLFNNSTHILTAKAYDSAGNTTLSSAVSVTVIVHDTIAPMVSITSPANNATVQDSVTIAASASDASGISNVEFMVDGILTATDYFLPYSVNWNTAGLPDNSVHTLTAKAYDTAGNTATSSTVSVTVHETVAPTVSVTSPANNATVQGSVAIAVSASDASGISKVDFMVDGVLLSTDTTAPYSATWNTTGLPDNSVHTLTARAYDNAGNTAVSSAVSVTVHETVAPTVSITSPVNNATLQGVVVVTAIASDASGISRVEFMVDSVLLATDTAVPFVGAWNTTGLPDNSVHTLMAKAYDTAGNTAVSGMVSVTVHETVAPIVSVTAPANGATVQGSVTVAANATDASGITKVEFMVDGVLTTTDTAFPYSATWNTAALVNNSVHTLTAKAYDTAGNTAVSSAVSVTVHETVAPTVSVTAPTTGSTIQGSVAISATAADASGISQVEFLVDGVLLSTDVGSPYSATWNTAVLANNSVHTLTAKAYDNAGNVATSTTVSVTVHETVPPTVSITSPLNGASVNRNTTVAINTNASDASGITKVEFYVNGVLKCTDTSTAYTCSWAVPAAKGVAYTLLAKAYDTAANVASSTTVSVTSK